VTDPHGWLEFAREVWYYPEFWEVDGREHRLSTGGWSGNESVIGAMQEERLADAAAFTANPSKGGNR